MKKTLVVGLAIGLVSLAATAAFAGKSADLGTFTHTSNGTEKNVGGTGIVGSSHDLSNVGGLTGSIIAVGLTGVGDTQSRICVFCHHPHNAMSGEGAGGRSGTQNDGLSYSPLWNRELSTQTFTGYNNGIMMGATAINGTDARHALNAADAAAGGTHIAGVSLLCMSCHDGVVAMNAYSVTTGSTSGAGNTAGTNAVPISGTAAFAGNMNNHHPMGFSYAVVQDADAEIAAENVNMVPGSTTTIGDLLYGANDTMECVTCHDVHNTANQAGAERFLWRTNDKSNFCLTCHLK